MLQNFNRVVHLKRYEYTFFKFFIRTLDYVTIVLLRYGTANGSADCEMFYSTF